MLQIFEPRNALDAFASQQAPQENHQTAVSNHQISRQHGAPIHLVFAQSRETGPGRSDEKSSALKHRRYRFIHVATEETDAKNLHTGSHQRLPNLLKHSRFALGTNLVSSRPVQNLTTAHKFTDAAPLSRRQFPLPLA